MKPMKLMPAFKDYIWGGTLLRDKFGKPCDLERIAESWELSCHPDGSSVVDESGKTLPQWLSEMGPEVLGTDCAAFEQFPILMKLIDAKQSLSVQVHPDNEYALRVEGEYGKTEMWYILDCEPGATLIYGFKKEISKEEFRERIENNTLLEVADQVPVHKGDVFFIESRTLHAIGGGILIAEIQQNSNTTYRVYDFGRLGADGKPRELHIDKALDVTALTPPSKPVTQGIPVQKDGYRESMLASCEYFTVRALDLEPRAVLNADSRSFHSLLCADGTVEVEYRGEKFPLVACESLFIPANCGEYTVSGNGRILLTTV